MNQEVRKKSNASKDCAQQGRSKRPAGKTEVKAAFHHPKQGTGAQSRSSGSSLRPRPHGGVPAARALAAPVTIQLSTPAILHSPD